MIPRQRTLAKKVTFKGIGLHTGAFCHLSISPAPANHGICFLRTDIPQATPIPALLSSIVDTSRSTILGNNNIYVHTVEHVMAALHGCHIDNALVEMSEAEPPAADGSAKPYVELLQHAGYKEQPTPRPELIVTTPFTYMNSFEKVMIKVFPANTFGVSLFVDYPPFLNMGDRFYSLDSLERFAKDIAPARTYCLLSEIKEIFQQGLGKGGSLENNVVFVDQKLTSDELTELASLFRVDDSLSLGNTGILDDRPLRFPNEPVRHKILDLVGDLYLLGMPIRGHVVAFKSGHKNNIAFLNELAKIYAIPPTPSSASQLPMDALSEQLTDFLPIPEGWKISPKPGYFQIDYVSNKVEKTVTSKEDMIRLMTLSAASALLDENLNTFRKISLQSIEALTFYKKLPQKKYKFHSKLIRKDGPTCVILSQLISTKNEVICEGIFTLSSERDA
ncbi:MAG: UDP-3-O-acyl-N-acetylglucosamine deacetylase [Candidatus Marinimicrobia bacterium]|nr:UDP-3-O-acyl-N-acetylglucosamine deacetylase [Candidatus Neomarinimicrobiota bacterium]